MLCVSALKVSLGLSFGFGLVAGSYRLRFAKDSACPHKHGCCSMDVDQAQNIGCSARPKSQSGRTSRRPLAPPPSPQLVLDHSQPAHGRGCVAAGPGHPGSEQSEQLQDVSLGEAQICLTYSQLFSLLAHADLLCKIGFEGDEMICDPRQLAIGSQSAWE